MPDENEHLRTHDAQAGIEHRHGIPDAGTTTLRRRNALSVASGNG